MSQSNSYQVRRKPQALYNGDKLTQREFHFAYSAMAEPYRAELIAGMVFEPPPPSLMHGAEDSSIGMLLATYSIHTPGTQCADNTTVVLSDEDEVQPDSLLRIFPTFGGQSSNWRRVIKGAPELVAEVSLTSRAIDLHIKKERYAKFGTKEYLVSCLEPREFFWFDFERKCAIEQDDIGICRSVVFPGLWINARALLAGDMKSVLKCLLQGIESVSHTEFVAELAKRDCS